MKGSFSTFGGKSDGEDSAENMAARGETSAKDAHRTEGLALYEHARADLHPDLFNPRNLEDPEEGTFRRLKDDALYFSYYWEEADRNQLRSIPWILSNPINGKRVMVQLVDRGPAKDLDRAFDISPMAAKLLELREKDAVEGHPIIANIP